MNRRQVVLDTETTGIGADLGHRIVEIGCQEILNRRRTGSTFHHYLNPDRDSDPQALEVHGLTREFLADKPRFKQIAAALLDFVRDAEVLIHNADFDAGFINAELAHAGISEKLENVCTVTDTLAMARKKHLGQKNGLDALCQRYGIDTSHRERHGALKDAQLLADVYLAMTAGQDALGLDDTGGRPRNSAAMERLLERAKNKPLVVLKASAEDLQRHRDKLQGVTKAAAKEKRSLIWATELADG